MNHGNMAVDILRATRDGNDLSPRDLRLVELAANNLLSVQGAVRLQDLHDRVLLGTYRPEWLHGIEHLTMDHKGYVYWKGVEVEHFSHADPERRREAALCLAVKCLHLERIGVPVNVGTAVWHWSWFEDMSPGNPWLRVLSRTPGLYERGGNEIVLSTRARVVAVVNGIPEILATDLSHDELWDRFGYHAMIAQGYEIAKAGQGEHLGTVYATTDGIVALLERLRIPPDVLG